MESTPVSGKDGTEGSLQDNLLHAAEPLDEEGTNMVVVENEEAVPPSLIGSFARRRGFKGRWLRQPSHVRTGPSRTSHETIKPHVDAPITNLSVPGRSVIIVRPRASSSQANTQEHGNVVLVEGDEEFVEDEAVCKFCFDIFKEESTLKTVCKCKNALIHEECAANWLIVKGNNNCDICGERIENFPVTLLKGLSSTQRVDRKDRNKQSLFSRLK